ncbi:15392_t:CDS:1 [Funneliformis geosporum]|uniref:15392_t:CDS:1 n=1 Tax=Funneliformis geosporum TaxID=1117311 RepID=A0A9W4SVW2_9GLOM|nr:15392_t:CDS:1 [Funneliformis geosporum]
MLPIKAFTVLSCGHVFHRECIEKIFLLTQQNNCPIDNCTTIVNPVVTERRFSMSSQSSTSSIVKRMNNQLQMDSPVIQEEERLTRVQGMEVDEEVNEEELEIQPDNQNSTPSSSKKRTNEGEDDEPQAPASRSSIEKLPKKKAKKLIRREDSPILKKLIKELSAPIPQQISSDSTISLQTFPDMDIDSVNFRELNDRIIEAEDDNKKTILELLCHVSS